MKDILVPISPGELLDKITILRIKAARMSDAAKLANVRVELELLERVWRDSGCAEHPLENEERALQEVNGRLWEIEDRIRDKDGCQGPRQPEPASPASHPHLSSHRRPDVRNVGSTTPGPTCCEKGYAGLCYGGDRAAQPWW